MTNGDRLRKPHARTKDIVYGSPDARSPSHDLPLTSPAQTRPAESRASYAFLDAIAAYRNATPADHFRSVEDIDAEIDWLRGD